MATPDSQELHKRARESASELRKLTTALSAGGVAALFVSLTTEVKPALTDIQRLLAAASVALFGLGVLAGMLAWQADAERWYFGAKEAEASDQESKDKHKAKRVSWSLRTWWLAWSLRYLFLAGVVFAVCYALARLFGWGKS